VASFLRGLGSAFTDYLAWWWGLPIAVGAVIAAVTFAPSDPGLAFAVIGLVCIPVGIIIITAYLGTLRARVKYLERLENEQRAEPDRESIDEADSRQPAVLP